MGGAPPRLDLKQEAALQNCLRELIKKHAIESAHDCSEGGLAVTLAESAFPAGVGVEVELKSQGLPPETVLFGETASRVVISCDPKQSEIIKKEAVQWGIALDRIGHTTGSSVVIAIDGKPSVDATVHELKQVWDTALAITTLDPVV